MLKILTNNRLFFIFFLLWVIFGALIQLFFCPTELIFWINQHHNDWLDVFFKYITMLGEDYIWLALLLFFLFQHFIKGITQTQSIKYLLIIWLIKVFVSISLKVIFNLPRPLEVYQNTGREIHLVDGVEIAYWQSFPSGHTMTAFTFACFILLYLKQKKIAIFALLIAILVGYSRMYLFQHFPRDVFAGSILGVAIPPTLKGAKILILKVKKYYF